MAVYLLFFFFFFFNDTATTEIYTLSLHDALPIYACVLAGERNSGGPIASQAHDRLPQLEHLLRAGVDEFQVGHRSEEHTSELQSQSNLVCRLLLEKKKKQQQDLLQCPLTTSTSSH